MKAYFELREKLAELYPSPEAWRRVAHDAGADTKNIVLEGAALAAWTNILNSLRVQNNLQGLTGVLERENPSSVYLARKYEVDVARGEGAVSDMPVLRTINLASSDLLPAAILESLRFETTLPVGLLRTAMRGQLTIEAIDSQVAGFHTNKAKTALQRHLERTQRELAPLEGQLGKAEVELKALKGKISSIESAEPPTMPESNYSPNLTDTQKVYWSNHYSEQLSEYTRIKANYDAKIAALPTLKLQATTAEQHVIQQKLALSNRRAVAETEKRVLAEAILAARDRDLLFQLDQTLDVASSAFHHHSNPFAGFWTLLGAAYLYNLFESNFAQPAAAMEAGSKFSGSANVFGQSIEQGLAEIAKKSLAGPLLVCQVLTKNRSEVSALAGRLDKLPWDLMELRCQMAQNILQEKLPVIPSSDRLETVKELETLRSYLVDSEAFVAEHIELLQKVISEESEELKRIVKLAASDCDATFERIQIAGEESNQPLSRIALLWDLVRLGATSTNLPPIANRLCTGLLQEFLRRTETDIITVIKDAVGSSWGLNQAQEFVEGHLLSRYQQGREHIQIRLSESQKRLTDIDAARARIDARYGEVVAEYKLRLRIIVIISALPLVGLAGAIWGVTITKRLSHLISSARIEYRQLGDFASKAFGAAAIVSVTVTAIVVALALYTIDDLDSSHWPAFAALIAVCFIAFGLFLRNLVKIRAHLSDSTTG